MRSTAALCVPLVGLGLLPSQRDSVDRSPYEDISAIRRSIRDALRAAGLGRKDADAPFCDIISPGATVLLKPNWVLDVNLGGHGMDCMVSHPHFVEAAVAEVLLAKPGSILLADAPVQSCRWDHLVTPDFRDRITALAGNCPVEFLDMRRAVLSDRNASGKVANDLRPQDRYILFNLGKDSLLEEVASPPGRFRITMYDPDRLARTHYPGHHQYLLCKEAFEADVVINLPKLKTHGKAGITASLKSLVGLNGNKDYLPHHRLGGTAWGGDCYPGIAPLKRMAEFCLDKANRRINTPGCARWRSRAEFLLRIHGQFGDRQTEGMWYGNDTCWRMVLDLNRVLLYGTMDGFMADTPQRNIWSLTDAIVCGEGEGPLAASPHYVGAISFSGSAPASDIVHAHLLGFSPEAIPLLREASAPFRWPLMPTSDVEVRCGAETLSASKAGKRFGNRARPHHNWAGHCELQESAL